MNATIAPFVASAPSLLSGLGRAMVQRRLERLESARLELVDAQGSRWVGPADAPSVGRVTFHRARAYGRIAADGSVGAGEAYGDGDWDADDLVGVMRALAREAGNLSLLDAGTRLSLVTDLVRHVLRANTEAGSRANIAAHYDLGNALFELFLDPTMSYSSGIFPGPASTLEEASREKIDRACRKLDLRPGMHLLEIGSGWGALAAHAASRYGCRVTTLTLSERQREGALARFAAEGVSARCDVQLRDYRDMTGRFDRVVSIEMVEAVGDDFLDTYYRKIGEVLAPDGLALIQAITIPDRAYATSLRTVDFVKKHVFPGCQIPSLGRLASASARTDLALIGLEDFADDYARTLRAWRERFVARRSDVLALGYDERFVRLWEFYLAYCEAGFAERRTGVAQLLYAKPGRRDFGYLPDLTARPRA